MIKILSDGTSEIRSASKIEQSWNSKSDNEIKGNYINIALFMI